MMSLHRLTTQKYPIPINRLKGDDVIGLIISLILIYLIGTML